MQLTKEQRSNVITKFKHHATDTGSSEVQIALFTDRINQLTEHFKTHKKDFAGRRGLLVFVSKRRALLDYLKRKNPERYKSLIAELDIRR